MGAVSRREHAHRGLVDGRTGFPIQRKEDVRTHGMPQTKTIERARRDKREGKSASTQAGEFVREEIETIRKGEHGARSASSDRHRPFQGSTCRGEVAGAREREDFGENS